MILRKVVSLLNNKDSQCPLPDGERHRAMILAQNTMEASKLKNLLLATSMGINERPAVYHTKYKHSKKELGRFMSPKCPERILIVVDSLREGFDFPPVSGMVCMLNSQTYYFIVVAICSSVVSPIKFYQFVGRGFRVCRRKDGTLETATIECDVVYHRFYRTLNSLYEQCRNEQLIEELEEKAKQVLREQQQAQQDLAAADDHNNTVPFTAQPIAEV